jgi:low affinity Fe/Cu permease
VNDLFNALARRVERWVGHPWAFVLAVVVVLVWALTGPLFRWSDTWQLVINTGTTIVTFLMVFLIQATQTRDTAAIHLKLAELLRAVEGARTSLGTAEDLPVQELDELREEIRRDANS